MFLYDTNKIKYEEVYYILEGIKLRKVLKDIRPELAKDYARLKRRFLEEHKKGSGVETLVGITSDMSEIEIIGRWVKLILKGAEETK